MVLVLSRQDVERLLDVSELIDALEEGFRALSAGLLDVPSRNWARAPNGVLAAMPAYMPDRHLSVKLVSVFHGNHERNLPDHQATITLFDSDTGAPLAFMDGEHVTAMRTAAAAILAARLLMRDGSTALAIIGAGVVGTAHLRALDALADIDDVRITSRTSSRAVALAQTDPRARAVESVEDAVSDADVVCVCTSSREPVVRRLWLKPGTHVSSVGYRPPGGELPRDLVESSHLFVESRVAFHPPPVGCVELQGLSRDHGTELGEVLLGSRPGRRADEETTVYKSMGHAMEDLVAGNLVYERALAEGVGRRIER